MRPPVFKLNTGASIPSVGLGTWQSKPMELEEAVIYAIDTVGYRLLDGAWGYGNEIPLGNALQQCKTPRDQIFVTTKVFSTYHTRASRGLRDSLAKLKLDYVDLYLMHWPVPVPPTEENYPLLPNGDRHVLHEDQWSYIDTWKEMEKLLKDGKCKAIGVSNMSITFLERLIAECEVVPAVNQVECHPLLPQEELVKYCQDKGIVVQAYSPLGSVNSPLQGDPEIQRVASNHGASASQVMISWLVAHGIVALPKSITPSRIKENFDIVSLSTDEIETLSTYAETHGGPKRFIDPPWGCSLGFTDGFGERKLSQIQFRSFPHVSEIIPPDN